MTRADRCSLTSSLLVGFVALASVQLAPGLAVAQTGACCLPLGGCAITTPSQCAMDGGTFMGIGTECAFANCSPGGAGAATPSEVPAGGQTLLTVSVSPWTEPPSTGLGVVIDLSPVSGNPSQNLSDDGTNGDAAAGDNVFSYSMTVDPGAIAGPYQLVFTISDAQGRSANGSIALTVTDPNALGACCGPDGSCSIATKTDCTAGGGTFRGDVNQDGSIDNFDCMDANCPQPGSPIEPGPSSFPPAAPNAKCVAAKQPKGPRPPATDPVNLFSGELMESATDMRLPGRGMDFVWSRRYRSRAASTSALGKNWAMSYDIRVAASGSDRLVYDGDSRADTYTLQLNGTWTRGEFFRELKQNPDASYTLTFEDSGRWDFLPLDGGTAEGKVSAIVDRNGNALTFSYDEDFGRLTTIHDTLDTASHNRDITIAYNASGFVSSVTDWAGRQIKYAYYQNGDAGGSAGDLKSVTAPAVTGTPNGNDFPLGKTTTYTYSKGFADPRLNGNLLTIKDPKGQTYVTNVYAATTVDADIEFDHVVRQIWGNPTDTVDLVYVAQAPDASNNFAVVKTILNDRVGNVTESLFDLHNNLVILREYTGRADPHQPTTESINRPTGKLRNDDPDFFETRYSYNADCLVTQTLFPNGNIVNNVWEADLNPSAPVRSRGNLREVHRLPGPLGGDQAEIVETYEYEPNSNSISQMTDGRGGTTVNTYDGQGNRLSRTQPIASVVENWEYNAQGQVTARVLPENGSGHRRRDEIQYYTSGPQLGYVQYEIVDATGLALTTTYEYDAVGNVIRVIDPRGHDTLLTRNALNQLVRSRSREVTTGSGVRYERLFWFDANDNIVRIDDQNRDETGGVQANAYFSTIFEYEILNNVTRVCREKTAANLNNSQLTCAAFAAGQAVTSEYEYDANRNRTRVRGGEAVNGHQPNNNVLTSYDERDRVYRVVQAPTDAGQASSQIDYDGNGNVRATHEGLESAPRVTTAIYDGYDRIQSRTDAMGNVNTYNHDADGNVTLAKVFGELVDVAGSAGNVRLFEIAFTFDAMNRQTRSDTAHFNTQTQAAIGDGVSSAVTDYTDNSEVRRVTTDNGHQTNYVYDTANRLVSATDAKNNSITYAYDANSNLLSTTQLDRSDLGNPNQSFVYTFTYDNADRKLTSTDPAGSVSSAAYDSRDNMTLIIDALGRQSRIEFDGLKRPTRTIRDMNNNGASAGDPADIVVSQSWDDSGRLISQTDDNARATTYLYDALNRRIVTQFADGTSRSTSYDVHENPVGALDANGSSVTSVFDALNRLVSSAIVPGPSVSSDTTAVTVQYDGGSRTVTAIDNDSTVARQYDSMSNVTRETLNGVITASSFDGEGNQLQCVYPGGRTVDRTFDALNRPLIISDGAGMIASHSYIGAGRLEQRNLGNGTRTDIVYDGVLPNPAGDFGVRMPVRITHSFGGGATILDDRSFTWDREANKTRRKDERLAGLQLTHDFTLDAANRLAQTAVHDGVNALVRDTGYSLDGVGNRVSVNGTGTPDAGAYTLLAGGPPRDAEMNQYTRTPLGDREYDANGNLAHAGMSCLLGDANGDGLLNTGDVSPFVNALLSTPTVCSDINQDGPTNGRDIQPFVLNLLSGASGQQLRAAIQYDYSDRMVEFRDTGTQRRDTYGYDALGRRIRKTVDADGIAGGPIETRYFYDGWQEIEERSGGGATLATFVYGSGIDEVLTMQRGAADYFYHADDLASVMAISNAAGGVVERYDYQDYGGPAIFDGAGSPLALSAIGNPLLFTGRRFDAETGFYYFRSRYLEPRAGRFTTRDAIGIWGDGANLGNGMAYVGDRPASASDPMGLKQGEPIRNVNINIGKKPAGSAVTRSFGDNSAGFRDFGASGAAAMRQGQPIRSVDVNLGKGPHHSVVVSGPPGSNGWSGEDHFNSLTGAHIGGTGNDGVEYDVAGGPTPTQFNDDGWWIVPCIGGTGQDGVEWVWYDWTAGQNGIGGTGNDGVEWVANIGSTGQDGIGSTGLDGVEFFGNIGGTGQDGVRTSGGAGRRPGCCLGSTGNDGVRRAASVTHIGGTGQDGIGGTGQDGVEFLVGGPTPPSCDCPGSGTPTGFPARPGSRGGPQYSAGQPVKGIIVGVNTTKPVQQK